MPPPEKITYMGNSGSGRQSSKPGETAPASGIYRVVHQVAHREAHDVFVIDGEVLPPCRTCRSAVTFTLVRAVNSVTYDWDFAGPLPQLLDKAA